MACKLRLTKLIEPKDSLLGGTKDASLDWQRLVDRFENIEEQREMARGLNLAEKTHFVKTSARRPGTAWKATVVLPSATEFSVLEMINNAINHAGNGHIQELQIDAFEAAQAGKSVPQGKTLADLAENPPGE